MDGCSHSLVREEFASQWQRAALPDRRASAGRKRWCYAERRRALQNFTAVRVTTSSVGEGPTVDMEANFPNFLAASSGTASRRGTKILESFTSSCRRAGCGRQIGHCPEVCGCMKHSFGV